MNTERQDEGTDTAEACVDGLRNKALIDALRSSAAVIFEQDLELRYVAFLAPNGPFTQETVVGKSPEDFLRSDEAAALHEFKRSVLASGQGARRQFRLTIQGQPLDYDVTAQPKRSADGKITGLLCIAWDVTRARATERALEDSQAQLRSFVSEAPTSFAMFDRELRYVAASRSWTKSYGRGHASVVGLRHYDIYPDTPEGWQSVLHTALNGEYQSKEEDLWTRPDGKDTWTRWTVFPWRDRDGKIGGVIVSIADISERKRAEIALRESEKKFRMMAETVPDILFMITPEGTSEYLNDNFYKITGLINDGKGIAWSAIHEDDIERIGRAWHTAMSTGEPFEERTRIKTAVGPARWFLVRARPMRDERGTIWRWFGCATDIEDQVREAALRETDRRKNEFLAMLSHELRNPLAAIRSATYVLENIDPTRPEAAKARGVIDRQSGHLVRIVDDLLDVARISWGKIQIERKRIDLRTVVQRTVDDARPEFEARGIGLALSAAEGELWVKGDTTRLTQVVANLLSNAAKFTPKGGHVEVFYEREGATAKVRVRDDGIGIDAAALSHIFEPFVQIDSTLDRSRGGLGLGLSVIQGIVELHGGSVQATSAGLGHGSEFTVMIPLDSLPANDEMVAPSRRSERRRVLVIEDSRDTAESLRQVLTLMGHEVCVAADGRSGIEMGRQLRPHIVLCDIGLPGMSGHEVARQMRRDDAFTGSTLVALSGYGQPEDRRRTAESGFTRHVVKPVTVDELEQILGSFAASTPASAPAASTAATPP